MDIKSLVSFHEDVGDSLGMTLVYSGEVRLKPWEVIKEVLEPAESVRRNLRMVKIRNL